jgi:uncharacterized RDD family membrane protein YckC
MSYTELMSALHITESGKLSFHLKKMEILLSQNEEKRYLLSLLGRKASLILSDIESTPHPSFELTGSTIARLPRRTAAYIIDPLLVFLIYLLVGQTKFNIGSQDPGQPITAQFAVIYFLLPWLYFTLFEGYRDQTFGKIFLRLRVKKTDGRAITYPDAAMRSFSKSIFFLLFADLLFGLKKKGYARYFDWLTGTTVVEE